MTGKSIASPPAEFLRQCTFGRLLEAETSGRLGQCLEQWLVNLEGQPRFQSMLARAERFMPTPGRTSWCERIVEGEGYRLTMLAVSRWHAIPKHDHPQTVGLLKVLRGRLRIRQFELSRFLGADARLVELETVGDRICRQGESEYLLPDRRNIHELIAVSRTAILISLQLTAEDAGIRSWFFPVSILEDDESMVICSRVEKP